jgi:hypothetical protein
VAALGIGLVVALGSELLLTLVLVGLMVALGTTPTHGLVVALGAVLFLALMFGLTAALVAALVVVLVAVLGFGKPGPARVSIRIRGRAGTPISDVALGLAVWLGIALVAGLLGGLLVGWLTPGLGAWAFGHSVGFVGWLEVGIGVSLGLGLAVGLPLALLDALQSPVDDALAVTPRSILRSDRTVAIVVGLVGWLVGWLVAGLGSVPTLGLGLGIVFGLVVGLALGLALMLGGTSWGQFTVARVWLAIRGQLPLRLMGFLDDAHRREVLRQAGAVYQFRHARLQDHLAGDQQPSV